MTTSMNKHNHVSLLDYWRVIRSYRKSIVAIAICVSVVAVIVSLILPKKYRAETVIIPVSTKGSGILGGLTSEFGGLASLAGISLSGSGGDDISKLKAILKSRTLAEDVIEREKLMPILFAGGGSGENQNMEEAIKKMKKHVNIVEDKKNGLIKISAIFSAPPVAARVANAYLEELQEFINKNAFTTAKRNRIFIEGQLRQNKRELLELGKELNEFYKTNRVSSVDANVDVEISSSIKAPTRSDMLEEQYAQLDKGAGTPLKADIDGLMVQKKTLDATIAKAKVVKGVPQQVYLTYLMMQRELLAKINALLTTQFEMAKIDETKEELAFQVIDKATVPIERFSPRRARICILSFLGALFFGVFLAFFREYLRTAKEAERRSL